MSNPDQALGQLVVRNLMAKPDDVRRCLEIQAAERSRGAVHRALGEILVSEGIITRRQLGIVLEEQARRGGAGAARLGPYEIQSRLGEGGMGIVYKGRDVQSGAVVALKVLARRFAENPSFLGRFRREAAAGQKLDHPHVVRTLALGEDRGNHFIALELMEGGDLSKRVKSQGVLPEREALEIARAVALALQHAHEQGLVHRDVKPSNIMFTGDGTVKLSDFGLVKSTDPEASQLTITGAALGTPHYISPEQALGEKDVDIRADLYSLGATLYHLVTGRPPFEGATPIEVIQKHLDQKLTPPDEIVPTLSDGCVGVIERMMAKDRADRYAGPAEVAGDLERVLRGEEPVTAAIEEARSSLKVSARRREKLARRIGHGTSRVARPAPATNPAYVAGGIGLAGIGIIVLLVALLWVRDEPSPKAPPAAVRPAARPTPRIETPPPSIPAPAVPVPPSEEQAQKALQELQRVDGPRADRSRRLEEFVRKYEGTFAAAEARALLNALQVPEPPKVVPKPAPPPAPVAPVDTAGLGPGLVATYLRFDPVSTLPGTPGPSAGAAVLRRVDAVAGGDWKLGAPHPSVPRDGFAVLWRGKLRVDVRGRYAFVLQSDDGVRLRVAGRTIVDRWVTQSLARAAAETDLDRGLHDLEIDYFDNVEDAECRFLWALRDGFAERPVPPEALWHDPATAAERLPAPVAKPDPPKGEDGWSSLFNGKDLAGWRTVGGSPRVENGVLVLERGAEVDQRIPAADFEVRGSLWQDSRGSGQSVGFSYRRPAASRSDNHVVVHGDGDAHLWDAGQMAAKSGSGRFPIRKWVPLAIRLQGAGVEVEIDGRVVLRGPVSRAEAGFLAFYSNFEKGEGRLELRDLAWRPLRP